MTKSKNSDKYCLKYTICVSGAAKTGLCEEGTKEKAIEVGRQIVKQGGVFINGATSGVPLWAAQGAKEAGGFNIGISPAVNEKDHLKSYRLPIDYMDLIIYTGFDYAGRNLLLTRAADAVIITCGRIGTLNEFTIAFEDKKPIGILTGTGGTADMVKNIVKRAKRGSGKIVYSSDPKELVARLIKLIEKEAEHSTKLRKKLKGKYSGRE